MINVRQSDDPLIQGIRSGDKNALVQFMEDKRTTLNAFIQKSMSQSLRSKVDAQDITQETLIEALRSFDKVDLQSISPYGWLCRLAEQRIIDAHRKYFGAQKRSADREVALYGHPSSDQSGAFLDLLVSSLTTPTQFILRDEKTRALNQQLESLPADVQEALRLRYVQGYSCRQIAREIGKSEGAVRVMLSRGVKKLRACLD